MNGRCARRCAPCAAGLRKLAAWTLPCLLALLFAAPPAARADTTAQILETQPDAPAVLGHRQKFWVRVAFETTEPVRIWVRPYHNGKPANAFSHGSSVHEGSGETLGWFGFDDTGEVDEIRIKVASLKPYKEWDVLRQPVDLRWTDAPAATEPQARWITELLAAEKAREEEAARQKANEPVTAGDRAFMTGFMIVMLLLLIGGLALPAWALWRWRGGWRRAAMVPVAVMAFVVLRIIIGTAIDPTSHNLWPFEILIFGLLSIAFIGVLALARRIRGAGDEADPD